MRFFVLFLLISLSLSAELDSYKGFLNYGKNRFKTVSDYAKDLGITQLNSEWEQFKLKFDRKYSPEEEEERKFNFLKTIQFIESHNKLFKSGNVSQEVDFNHFADWVREWSSVEYKSILNSNLVTLPSKFLTNELKVNITTLPDNFDWRHHDKVTSVKDQGRCGSCWAFATLATIESAFLIKQNKSLNLSEQQLLDCCNQNNGHINKTISFCFGCNGCYIQEALKYMVNFGVGLGNDYEYIERQQRCQDNSNKLHVKISGFKQLAHPSSDQDIMRAIYTNGPVAVFIDANGDDFKLYRRGVFRNKGSYSPNHYVTVIGWGPDYWIIKNSWGTHWGEQGFGNLAKGMNLRGFNNYVFYPVL